MAISNSTENVASIGAPILALEAGALRTLIRESVRASVALTEQEERSIETQFLRRARKQIPTQTLFEHLRHIRANVKRARTDVMRLRTLIRGSVSVEGERTAAEDMRIQLRQALRQFDELLSQLTPIAEFHFDQPIRATAETVRGAR